MRFPPIAWAGLVTVVVLGIAITAGLLLGPGTKTACATPSAGATATPAACVTASPTP